MKTVKFIVPATYTDTAGNEQPYTNAGQIVEVPEADAQHFIDKGWKKASKDA